MCSSPAHGHCALTRLPYTMSMTHPIIPPRRHISICDDNCGLGDEARLIIMLANGACGSRQRVDIIYLLDHDATTIPTAYGTIERRETYNAHVVEALCVVIGRNVI